MSSPQRAARGRRAEGAHREVEVEPRGLDLAAREPAHVDALPGEREGLAALLGVAAETRARGRSAHSGISFTTRSVMSFELRAHGAQTLLAVRGEHVDALQQEQLFARSRSTPVKCAKAL
jgi:hypothetical protein